MFFLFENFSPIQLTAQRRDVNTTRQFGLTVYNKVQKVEGPGRKPRAPKTSPLGAPKFTPWVDTPHRTPFLERTRGRSPRFAPQWTSHLLRRNIPP